MAILAVCLNPVLERIHTIAKLRLGDRNFADTVVEVPSGFGITAARVAKRLGESVAICTLSGQVTGRVICQKLEEEGILVHSVGIQAASRQASTVFERLTGRSSMVSIDPSPQVSDHELARFEQALGEHLGESDLVLIGGSLPAGVPSDIYGKLIEKCKATGKKAILDTREPALNQGIANVPHMVKLDLEQATVLLSKKRPTRREICSLASQLHSNGIEIVAITQGRKGALVAFDEGVMFAVPPVLEAVNTYGSGDAFVAGFAVGLIKGQATGDCIRLATACGAANARTLLPGYIDKSEIYSLFPKVGVRRSADRSCQRGRGGGQ